MTQHPGMFIGKEIINVMEKEFVPYDLALRLKALGFDEPCFGMYNKDEKLFIITPTNEKNFEYLLVPTFSQAFRWFREKLKDSASEPYSMVAHTSYNRRITFEEAELACLDKLIEFFEGIESQK